MRKAEIVDKDTALLYLTDCLLATVEDISKNPIPKVQTLRNEYSRLSKIINEYDGDISERSLKLNQ